MNAVKKDVEALVQKELDAANKKFPLFHSAHEGYAVLLEETEELDGDNASIKYDMLCLWNTVKSNNTEAALKTVSHTYERAVNAAIEAIQVAAMCEKFKTHLGWKQINDYIKPKSDESAPKVLCRDCEYFNAGDDKPIYCHGNTSGLGGLCCFGKKRGDNDA